MDSDTRDALVEITNVIDQLREDLDTLATEVRSVARTQQVLTKYVSDRLDR